MKDGFHVLIDAVRVNFYEKGTPIPDEFKSRPTLCVIGGDYFSFIRGGNWSIGQQHETRIYLKDKRGSIRTLTDVADTLFIVSNFEDWLYYDLHISRQKIVELEREIGIQKTRISDLEDENSSLKLRVDVAVSSLEAILTYVSVIEISNNLNNVQKEITDAISCLKGFIKDMKSKIGGENQ